MDLRDHLVGLQSAICASIGAHPTNFAATRDRILLAAMLPLGISFGAVRALNPWACKMMLASYQIGSRLDHEKNAD